MGWAALNEARQAAPERGAQPGTFLSRVFGVAALTMLSRVFGLVRDAVMTARFGAGAEFDAWNIAFLLPNLLRRVLAEGALSLSMVPVFGATRTRDGDDAAKKLFQSTFGLYLVFASVTLALFAVFAEPVVALFAPGFSPELRATTVTLTRECVPFLYFIALSTVAVAALQTFGRFNLAAAQPIVFNIGIIVGVSTLAGSMTPGIASAAVGAGVGSALAFVMLLIGLARAGFRLAPRFEWKAEHREMLQLMGPGLAGIMVYYLNSMVSRAYASMLPTGSISLFYLSDRLIEVPLGVFAVSIATVSLPRFTALAAAGDAHGVRDEVARAARLSLFICLPAATGMAGATRTIVRVLFERGSFDATQAEALVAVVHMALLGIVAMGAARVLVQAFYGLKAPGVVVRASFASFVFNAAAGYPLMMYLGAPGLALGISLSMGLQAVVLAVLLRARLAELAPHRGRAADDDEQRVATSTVQVVAQGAGGEGERGAGASFASAVLRMTVAALAMGVVVLLFERSLLELANGFGFVGALALLCAEMALGGVLYVGFSAALGVEELSAIRRRLRRVRQ